MQNKYLPFLLVVLAGFPFCYGDAAGSDGKEFFSKLSWEKILEGDAEKPTGAPHVPRVEALPEGLAEKIGFLEKNGLKIEYSAYPSALKPKKWTVGYIGYSEKSLYVLAKAETTGGYKLSASILNSETSQIWNDDNLEIFIDPFFSKRDFFHFIINPLGEMYDARCVEELVPDPQAADPSVRIPKISSDMRFSSGAKVQVIKKEAFWAVWIEIPMIAFGLENAPEGEAWGFNFCHANRENNELSQWRVTNGSFLNPKEFGPLSFGSNPNANAVKCALPYIGYGTNIFHLKTDAGLGNELHVKTVLKDDQGKIIGQYDQRAMPEEGTSGLMATFEIPFGTTGKTNIFSTLQKGGGSFGVFVKSLVLNQSVDLLIPQQNVYVSDGVLKGRVYLHLGEQELSKSKVVISVKGPEFYRESELDNPTANALAFEIKTGAMPPGDYDVLVKVMSGNKRLGGTKNSFSLIDSPF